MATLYINACITKSINKDIAKVTFGRPKVSAVLFSFIVFILFFHVC